MHLLRSTLTVVAILAAAGGMVAAQSPAEKVYDVSTAALVSGAESTGTTDRLVSESWGFEPGEGFAPGFVGGQVGWTVFAASVAEAHIDTLNPFAGVQHLRISLDPAAGGGTLIGAFSPDVTDPIVDASSTSLQVAIGDIGGADYDVAPQAPSQAFLTARVSFAATGDILVLDDPGGGLTFVDTGTDWTPGVYKLLEIDVDPVGNTIDYSYDGALIYSSVAGVFAGTVIEQVVLLSNNLSIGESGDFDDLFIERGAVPVELQSLSIE